MTIKWDLPIKRRTVGDILNQKEFYKSDLLNELCVYSDLDDDPKLQMTVQEFFNIDKDLQTSQDVSDVNIIESVISDTSEDSQTDDDDDIEEVQPTCKQVTDSLNIVIKFFEMESSTVESDMAKLFYFKELIYLFIYLFIKHVLFILMSLYKCKMYVSRVETI